MRPRRRLVRSTGLGQNRVLAWWDVNVQIGPFHKRKMTSRPLKDLERALGYRLHVEAWERFSLMPEGAWKFHAYHYIDTADPALAAYTMLKQLSPMSRWFGMSGHGFNATAATLSGDVFDDTICAFYWNPPDQLGRPRYVSSGVMLMLVDPGEGAFDRDYGQARRPRSARPVVQVHVREPPADRRRIEKPGGTLRKDPRTI